MCRFAASNNVRLVGGRFAPREGRVEVLHNGEWGTVCDDLWDLDDAKVVCRQLGFADALAVKIRAYFGQGSGKIWMDDVDCVGSEASLQSCTFDGWENHNCGHDEDAGVVCRNGNIVISFSTSLHFVYQVTVISYHLSVGLSSESAAAPDFVFSIWRRSIAYSNAISNAIIHAAIAVFFYTDATRASLLSIPFLYCCRSRANSTCRRLNSIQRKNRNPAQKQVGYRLRRWVELFELASRMPSTRIQRRK